MANTNLRRTKRNTAYHISQHHHNSSLPRGGSFLATQFKKSYFLSFINHNHSNYTRYKHFSDISVLKAAQSQNGNWFNSLAVAQKLSKYSKINKSPSTNLIKYFSFFSRQLSLYWPSKQFLPTITMQFVVEPYKRYENLIIFFFLKNALPARSRNHVFNCHFKKIAQIQTKQTVFIPFSPVFC